MKSHNPFCNLTAPDSKMDPRPHPTGKRQRKEAQYYRPLPHVRHAVDVYVSTTLQLLLHKARLDARRPDPDITNALSVSTAKRPSHKSNLSSVPRGGKANSKSRENTTLGIGSWLRVTATNSVTASCGIDTRTNGVDKRGPRLLV